MPATATWPMPSPMQRQPLLHEEHADERRGSAHHEAGEQRELHVGAVERPGQDDHGIPGRPSISDSPHHRELLEPEREVVAVHAEAHAGGRELGRRAVEQHAALQHDHVVEVVGDRAELVRHEQHRGVVVLAPGGRASRGTAAATPTSTPAIGSSSTSSSGSAASALAISARCCWPPESSREPLAAVLGERDRLERVVDRVAVDAAAPAPPPLLRRGARRPRPPRRWRAGRGRCAAAAARTRPASGRGRSARRDAEHLDRARGGREQPEQDAQQRRLARAVRARRARRTRRRARSRPTSVEHQLRRRRRTTRRRPRARPAPLRS